MKLEDYWVILPQKEGIDNLILKIYKNFYVKLFPRGTVHCQKEGNENENF